MRSSFIFLGILGGAIPALAQPAATNPPAPATVRDEVLVTAALVDEERDRLPVSADVVDADEIAERQATTVADLLRTIPGLDVVRSGTAGKVTSLFTRGTESDHTLVLWNGIELNDPYFGGFDWGVMPTEGVERVEVIRGPFSALYGSDALGGVVQVLTGGGSGGSVLLEAGDGGHARVAASGRGEVGPARLAAAGHSRQSDGEIDNDSFDSDALMASADFDLGPSVGVGLVARAHDTEVGVPFSGGAATPRRTNSWRAREIALPFDAVLGDWVLEGRLSRVFHDRELHDPDDPSGFTFAGSESTSRRARMVASHRFDDDLWLAVGGEHEEQEVDSGSVFGTDLDGDSQSTRAAFAQLFWAAGAWRFDLGLRHDDHDAFGARTTPRVGVVRRLGKRSRLRAAYGEGFRAPSIGELYFPFSGNPDLLPEESSSVEVGYQLDGRRWSASLTAFENELENLIDFEFVSFRNVNVGRARTRGVELGAARRWDRADLRLQVTQLDAEDLASGLALLRRPEWRASAVAAWRPEEWTFSATAVHTGERADVDPITFLRRPNPAHQRLDLAVRYEGWPRFAPYARVENATDERYAEALGFDAPGRQWIGGVDLRF